MIPHFPKKLRKLFDQEQADLTARVLFGDRELEAALPVRRARVEAQTSPEFRDLEAETETDTELPESISTEAKRSSGCWRAATRTPGWPYSRC